MDRIVKPSTRIQFNGPGGKSVAIVGLCERVARKAGWDSETIGYLKNEMLSLDR